MPTDMSNAELERPQPREEQVAKRWLRSKGVTPPQEEKKEGERFIKDISQTEYQSIYDQRLLINAKNLVILKETLLREEYTETDFILKLKECHG